MSIIFCPFYPVGIIWPGISPEKSTGFGSKGRMRIKPKYFSVCVISLSLQRVFVWRSLGISL